MPSFNRRPWRCDIDGHYWSVWGRWYSVVTPFTPGKVLEVPTAAPQFEDPKAYRDRICAKCGAREVQNRQGKSTVVERKDA